VSDLSQNTHQAPLRIARADHNISRKSINENALKVLYRLNNAGYEALLVGGGVRDLLLGLQPKDFDVATDARPEQAAAQFKNGRLIGRRFRLLHVRFGREIIEVATFRAHHDKVEDDDESEGVMQQGMIVRDNVYGNIEEDAWRRDFTVNALYYDIKDFSIIDYTGGLDDLRHKILRCIGDPAQRYCEDPVRMIRAVRLAVKLEFKIEPHSEAPIFELADKLQAIPAARLFEEVLKLFLSGCAAPCLDLLRHYGLFKQLFPYTESSLQHNDSAAVAFLRLGLKNTDVRIEENKPVTPAFLFAILLWPPLMAEVRHLVASQDMSFTQALQVASGEIIGRQIARVSLPRRYSVQVREIWLLQAKLQRRQGKRAQRLLEQPRFRAGYDFLLLRSQSSEPELSELAKWWEDYQKGDAATKQAMQRDLEAGGGGGGGGGGGRRRKRRRRHSSG